MGSLFLVLTQEKLAMGESMAASTDMQSASGSMSYTVAAMVLFIVVAVVTVRTVRRLAALVMTLLGLTAQVFANMTAVIMAGLVVLVAIVAAILGA